MHTAAENSPTKTGAWTTMQRPKRILGLLFLLSVVTCLDRVNISIATPSLEREFGLDRLHICVMRQWAGICDMTSDYSPILGKFPN
jgi:hypothetical protein